MRALAARCLPHAPEEGPNPTAIRGLSVFRQSAALQPRSAVYEPGVFLVTQGRKETRVGDEAFVYDPDAYLVTSVPLPVVGQILEASPERPFLSLALRIELETVREIMTQAGDTLAPAASEPPQRGLAACPVTPEIQAVATRLLDLLDRPEDVPALAPLYLRELLYFVLKGPRGGFLRAAAMGNGQQRAISGVLTTLHADCRREFSVPQLSAMAGMSESVFYEAFKQVTAATPLQYIKRLRLQEAHRQLSLGLDNVSGVAYGVGYNSVSQFSREFTRVFGANPQSVLTRDRRPPLPSAP